MTEEYTPHPRDAHGDFHVEDDMCLACHIPRDVAPELFGEHDHHCFVKRQPRGDAELSDMLRVIGSQCVGCVTYRGEDRVIKQRIANVVDARDLRDHGIPDDVTPQRRDRVRFRATPGLEARDVMERYLDTWRRQFRNTKGPDGFRHRDAEPRAGGLAVELAWAPEWLCDDPFHHFEVVPPRRAGDAWTILQGGPISLSFRIQGFLAKDPDFSDQDWRSDDELRDGAPPAPTPW